MRNNLGISQTFNSEKEYADAILSIYKLNKDEYSEMCKRAKEVSKKL